MGEEEETMTEVAESTSNGTGTPEDKGEDVPRTKEEENDGAKEMDEDRKDYVKVEARKMVVDQVGGENKKTEEKKKEGKQSKEVKDADTKEDMTSDDMEEEMKAKENGESDEKGEEKVDELKEEYEMDEESKQEKRSKGHKKGKTLGIKAKSNKKEEGEENLQKIHVASPANRPVRARKAVERLVESFELESVKEFHVEKGYGTALKDIPNVAFKLSKRSTDDTLKLLHTILFGRRVKAARIKTHIYQFSGFVLTENEEKQKIKMKEKLDKCVKEKLLGFCDVLDIPIAKADTTKTNMRKEDIIAKLIDFLVAPQATTSELLSEQSGKKRKRVGKQNALMSGCMSSKSSAKKNKMTQKLYKQRVKNGSPEMEVKLEEEGKQEENSVRERSKNDVPRHSDSEESKDEFEPNAIKKDKPVSKKSSVKKESAGTLTERTPVKSSSNVFDVDGKIDQSPKTFSQKKRADGKVKTKEVETLMKSSPPTEKSTGKSSLTFSRKKNTEVVKENSFTTKKHDSMEKTGKKVVKGKNQPEEHKLRPSDDELRNAVCDILKEVDLNTATFTDILRQLAGRYNTDLTSRKSSIKIMVHHELTKLADEDDDEEEDD